MSQHQPELFPSDPAPWETDDAMETLVASVVFAEAPFGPFDYVVPAELRDSVAVGKRLRVPLGRGNRQMTSYCIRIEQRTGGRALKDVSAVIDDKSLLTSGMLRLAQWMTDYYLCPMGQVLDAIVPAGVRGKAGTREVTLLSVPTAVVAKLTQLKLPPKQAEVLKILALSPEPMTAKQLALAAKCTTGPINGLRDKKLLRAERRRVQSTDVEQSPVDRQTKFKMNAQQQEALDVILAALHAGIHETVLLHGVTGSGKTEVYIQAIEEMVGFGRQAIVLVPEISLTPQTKQRFRSRFENVAVLHSHLSDSERHWHWQRIAAGQVQVVVGARSAVFAPTPHLGLIVLDEEHDASFKQDQAPRYNARDVALERARMEKIPVVLGSATPSLESWHRACETNFRLVELPGRVMDRPLPDVSTIDLRIEFENQRTRGAISRQLHQAIAQSLNDEGQVILLLNRRGFSTSIQCPACGYVARCDDCDIALTHHREENKAVCHYCDYTIPAPTACAECNFTGIRYAGLGTQRLEQEVRSRFPGVEILRMDSDTMRKPGSHERALASFREGKVKILVGTQMIAKGLDFPDVTLVGVINADTALHFPDFRAAERTFQLVTQVAGRTGRGPKGGRVLVQTFSPDHPAIVAATKHDYIAFAKVELPTRREFGYPPISSMVRLVMRGSSENITEQFADCLVERLEKAAEQTAENIRVLGPAPAPISKIKGMFRYHALLQSANSDAIRAVVRKATEGIKVPDGIQWIVDVDPLNLL